MPAQTGLRSPTPVTNRPSIALLYKSNVQLDGQVLNLLQEELARNGCQVFLDRHLTIGVEWARQIENRIRQADAVIVLLSAASTQSEMIAYEIEIAHETAQQHWGVSWMLCITFFGRDRRTMSALLANCSAPCAAPKNCLRRRRPRKWNRLEAPCPWTPDSTLFAPRITSSDRPLPDMTALCS